MFQSIRLVLISIIVLAFSFSDVFYSEYGEGSGTNKYLELYNSGPDAADLGNYTFQFCSNACTDSQFESSRDFCEVWDDANSDGDFDTNETCTQTPVLQPGETWVVCDKGAGDGLLALCDQAITLSHNGNDAQGLFLGDTLIDVIGDVSNYEYWDVGSTGSTRDKSLVRKPEVTAGTTDWNASAGTTDDDSQWIVGVKPEDTVTPDTVGNHTCDLPGDSGDDGGTTPDPDVYIVGDMNGWVPGSDGWGIVTDGGVGALTASLSANTYGYKAVEGSSWDDSNYPGNNQSVTLTEDGDVTFYVNVDSDLVFHTNPTVVGDFFSSTWDSANIDGEMMPVEGTPYLWEWTGVIPEGSWEYKVVLNQNFDQSTGNNISITGDGVSITHIYYDFSTNSTSSVTDELTYSVTFNVNLSYETVDSNPSDVKVIVFGTADAVLVDDDGDGVYTATVALTAGDHEYKFYNGWYENVDNLDCAVQTGSYWNRTVTVADSDLSLDTVCYELCSDCVPGCLDENASNTTEGANVDDGSCEYAQPAANLFFSENAEGSGNNKYLEIYNASSDAVDLSSYAYPSNSNAPEDDLSYEYWNTFDEGATVGAGDVYVICHGSATWGKCSNGSSTSETSCNNAGGTWTPTSAGDNCDETHNYLSNGDDGYCLTFGTETNFEILDCVGAWDADPGSAWSVAGVSNATKDHTLVRKASVTQGNTDWAASSGTDEDNSEWIVLEKDTWDFLGSHPHSTGCNDSAATNYDDSADINDGSCEYACDDVDEDDVCDDVDDCVGAFDECGACNGPGPIEGYDCDGNLLVNVTFNVDMSNETVDTEGYGLDLFMPNPYGWHDMTDDDGDGVWSVTLTLVAETSYSYKFKNGDTWEANFNDLGCGDGSQYGNRTFTTGGEDQSLDAVCFSSCSACAPPCSYDGNVNGDDIVNVSDVVMIVGWIIGNGTADACTGDVNQDGAVDVSDVVMIVSWIIGGRADIDDATNANIVLSNNNISIEANGQVSGLQMTLSHGNDFSIDLADAYISEYSTNGNITKLVVVSANSSINHVASCKGSFNVDSAIVVNSNQEIADVNILNLEPVELTLAGPNPFNPTTSLNVVVANDGYVSVNVYNITGQHIATLLNGYMDANTSGYMVNWNASNLSSGVYLVRAETAGSVSTQKLMLLK